MTVATFTSCDRETVIVWRSPIGLGCDGPLALVPYWSPTTPCLFLLDCRTGRPWFAVSPTKDGGGGAGMSLAPAPYLGALSAVPSDLLTEEGP